MSLQVIWKNSVMKIFQHKVFLKCMTCLAGANSYTLNERLFAVPLHGADTPCTVCGTTREPEYETEGSYIRYF